jgi:hypothetical protein
MLIDAAVTLTHAVVTSTHAEPVMRPTQRAMKASLGLAIATAPKRCQHCSDQTA